MGIELPLWVWFAFLGGVLGMLALDLGVFHRKSHVVSTKEAAIWSAVWVSLSLVFAAGVYLFWPDPTLRTQKGTEWLAGYILEKSLSVDNIFVFVMVFSFFAIPPQYQHRVLFWGIIGALVMRAIMIFAGAALIKQFHWIIYVFGAFLLFTGAKMLFSKEDEEVDLNSNPAVKLARRFFKVSDKLDGEKFFTVQNGVKMATPLFLCLVFIEFTDVIFAVDSIPAIFAITKDPFIVFTSNIMAILGLRSMYFMLASVVDKFVYLKTGLSFVLVFIGVKMMITDLYKIPVEVSLGVILTVLVGSVVASLVFPKAEHGEGEAKPAG
jgi:tellurite resistance protein TerC